MSVWIANTALLLQDSASIITRIWAYLTQQFTFGRITVSVSSVPVGFALIALTIALAKDLEPSLLNDYMKEEI